MNRVTFVFRSLGLLCFLAAGVTWAADPAGAELAPDKLISKVAQDVLKDLDANRAEYKKDPKKVRAVVDKYMLPNFDTKFAAQQVLGVHRRSATPEQLERFVEAFYQSLLQTYGEQIVEFTPDRLTILPFKSDPNSDSATVKSRIRRDNGSYVSVNYSMRKTAAGWKAYDVVIENVSYLISQKRDIGGAIQRDGLEAVIKRLEQQVATGTVPKPDTAKPAA